MLENLLAGLLQLVGVPPVKDNLTATAHNLFKDTMFTLRQFRCSYITKYRKPKILVDPQEIFIIFFFTFENNFFLRALPLKLIFQCDNSSFVKVIPV